MGVILYQNVSKSKPWGIPHTRGSDPEIEMRTKGEYGVFPTHVGGSIATETLAPVPYAKPVLKKDDPAGYERYKAYKRYSSLRNKAMKSLTLDQVSQWFESEKQRMN